MRIEMLLGAAQQRRWHEELVRRLRDLPDCEVAVRLLSDPPSRASRRLSRLLALERLLHHLPPGGMARGRLTASTDTSSATGADIVLDLTSTPGERHWRVLYDGTPGEEAAADALRSGTLPVVTVVDAAGSVRATGRPGSETPGLLATALPDLGAGVATLVLGAITGSPFSAPLQDRTAARRPRSYAELAVRRVLGRTIRVAYRFAYRAPHWRVGWRRSTGPGSITAPALPSSGWHDLPDDGLHFYADPFPFAHEDQTVLFVEDFDHRRQRAVISAVPMGSEGPEGTPVPVLTHDVHLSYPCVLAHAGEVWMIPETSNARTVELYRSVEFPWKWERYSVLLEGVAASDATPFQYAGKWWMTATVDFGGSLSDSLCLWSAPELWGPWTPHAHNPVLVDIGSARPAGHVISEGGRLLRPVQDCRGGYGAAMAVAEITRLDDDGFEQRVIAQYQPGNGWSGSRLHTLNFAGGIETIDGSRLSPRFRRSRS